jgi:hypothetical protein
MMFAFASIALMNEDLQQPAVDAHELADVLGAPGRALMPQPPV